MIAQTLVDLVRQLDENPDTAVTVEKIKLIGATADYVGGFAGKKRLYDAAENIAGNDGSIGQRLDELWEGRKVSGKS